MSIQEYVRTQAAELRRRLEEPRRFIQVVAGPRQVGKTTLVTHVADTVGLRHVFASADEGTSWTSIVRHLPDVLVVRAAELQ